MALFAVATLTLSQRVYVRTSDWGFRLGPARGLHQLKLPRELALSSVERDYRSACPLAFKTWQLIVQVRGSPGNQRGNLEAFILSLEDYSAFISQHSMQVLITLWLPNDFVLRQKYDPKKAFSFDKQALVKSLEHTRERDLRVAEKHFIKHDASASKKVLIHFVRYLELAVQISKEGKITCYTSANDCRNTILENYSSEWRELLTEVQPLMVSLLSALVQ